MIKPRTKRACPLRVETMEGRALLAGGLASPLAQLPAPWIASQGGVSVLNDNDTIPSGVYEGAQVEKEKFSLRNGTTKYDARFNDGVYQFDQSYKMDVNRVRGRNSGNGTPGLTALDAIDVFTTRLATQVENVLGGGGNGGGGMPTQDGDYVIERERFRHRNGETTYELTIRSGGYRFKQRYEMDIDRENNNNQHGQEGTYTAVGAIEAFYAGLFTQIDNQTGGGNGNGGGGGMMNGRRAALRA